MNKRTISTTAKRIALRSAGKRETRAHMGWVGRHTSPAKAEASRVNGAKGGRPRKNPLQRSVPEPITEGRKR